MLQAHTLTFRAPDINVHLARFADLSTWQHQAMPAQFWRIYWNSSPGAWIQRLGTRLELTPNTWTMISPGAPLATGLEQDCQHLYIHFSVGPTLLPAQAFMLQKQVTDDFRFYLESLRQTMQHPSENIALNGVKVQAIIYHCLAATNPSCWQPEINDDRILTTLNCIHRSIALPPSAEELGQAAHMHPKSLGRLFRRKLGTTMHQYGLRYRLNCAMNMLLQSPLSIEDIASRTGFSDRYHMSKAIRRHCGKAPGELRKMQSAALSDSVSRQQIEMPTQT